MTQNKIINTNIALFNPNGLKPSFCRSELILLFYTH